MDVLGSQDVICSMGCNRAVRSDEYKSHLESQCKAFYSHSIHSPSRTTIGDLLAKDRAKPPTPAEKRVAQNIITRMMAAEGSSNQVLQLPTRGQVIMDAIVVCT